ncbi:MAG: hypothetical protein V7749_00190 [Cocleimonas sp.]
MNNLTQFYLQPTTVNAIERFSKQELRTVLLSRIISKTMNQIFSKQTLARLDKSFLTNGFSKKMQIDEVSKIAVQELLNREVIAILDNQLLNDAWKKVYSAGVCPTNIQVSH